MKKMIIMCLVLLTSCSNSKDIVQVQCKKSNIDLYLYNQDLKIENGLLIPITTDRSTLNYLGKEIISLNQLKQIEAKSKEPKGSYVDPGYVSP